MTMNTVRDGETENVHVRFILHCMGISDEKHDRMYVFTWLAASMSLIPPSEDKQTEKVMRDY